MGARPGPSSSLYIPSLDGIRAIAFPGRSLLARCLEWSWLGHLRQLSYSMYLVHHTLFHHFYHHYQPSVLIAGTVFMLTLLYAEAMRMCVELPLQRARKRWDARPGVGILPVKDESGEVLLAS